MENDTCGEVIEILSRTPEERERMILVAIADDTWSDDIRPGLIVTLVWDGEEED